MAGWRRNLLAQITPHRVHTLEVTVALAALGLIAWLHLENFRYAGALWRDEVVTYHVATMPTLAELWFSIPYDSFPGAVHLFLRLWTGTWGNGEDVGLRVFGIVVGFAVVAALWISGRLLGATTPLLGLVLVGFSPVVIRYGDSIRAYGLGMVTIVLTFGLLWNLTRTTTLRNALLAATMAILSVHTLYQNLFLLFGICAAGVLVTAVRAQWARTAVIVAVGVVAAVSLVPYWELLRRASNIKQLMPFDVTLVSLLGVLAQSLSAPLRFMFWVWMMLFVLGLGVAVAKHWPRREPPAPETDRAVTLFCAAAMITGTVSFMAFMKFLSLPSQPWNYTPLIALAGIALQGIFAAVKLGTWGKRATLAASSVMIAIMVTPAWHGVQTRQTNIDLIAGRLEATATPEDLILVHPWYCGATFQRYYRGLAPWTTLPPHEDLKLQRKDIFKARMVSVDPIRPVLERISLVLETGHRVWVVGNLPHPAPGMEPPAAPPAPHAPWGWNHDAYAHVWGLHAGHLLQTRGRRVVRMPGVFDAAVNPYENLSVAVVEGWRHD